MKPYKACWCRDGGGRLLGKKCPALGKRSHGKWYGRYEAPPGPDGKRRQPRVGPYDTEHECKAALYAAAAKTAQTGRVYDLKVTLGEYLELRHGWRLAEAAAGGGVKRSTLATDREIIDLYLKPGLGHLRLVDQLGPDQIRQLYAAIRLIHRPAESGALPDLLYRLLAARSVVDRHPGRPISPARIKRVHVVLHAALNDAVKVSRIRNDNPADGVLRPKGGRGHIALARPLLWTGERVERWERTGEVPAKVMVWSAAQCGAFLDFAEGDRLYSLWHLAAYWGLRRGELVALDWTDLSLDWRRLSVRWSQTDDEVNGAKTASSERTIVVDPATAQVQREWRLRQRDEHDQQGHAWVESGRVFTRPDGRALRPKWVSERFAYLIRQYGKARHRHDVDGWTTEQIARRLRISRQQVSVALAGPPLPPVRFHDLRHGSATMLLAAGVDLKVVSEILGHASVAFTADAYTTVVDELAEDAAIKISAFVPRHTQVKS
ncbi:site-specific integrase [Spirillospora sp. NBC_00431]